MTGKGEIVEMQGATEKAPISWDAVEQMQAVAHKGIKEILSVVHSDTVATHDDAGIPDSSTTLLS